MQTTACPARRRTCTGLFVVWNLPCGLYLLKKSLCTSLLCWSGLNAGSWTICILFCAGRAVAWFRMCWTKQWAVLEQQVVGLGVATVARRLL